MKRHYKKILLVSTLILLVFTIGRMVMYGSVFRNCAYTADTIPAPTELAAGKLKIIQAAASIENYQVYSCAGGELATAKIITESQYASNYTYDTRVTSTNIPIGKEFVVVGIKRLQQHGLSLGGHLNSYFLILKDSDDSTYLVSPVSMGINSSDRYFSFVQKDGTETIVGPDNFTTWGTSPFLFNLQAR